MSDIDEELLDEDGYPTDFALKRVTEWDYGDPRGWFEFIASIWHWPDYASIEGSKVELSTGGWSGNESIIGAMHGATVLWMCTWEQSRRGGHFLFDLSRCPQKEPARKGPGVVENGGGKQP